jgi:hypothetical protein
MKLTEKTNDRLAWISSIFSLGAYIWLFIIDWKIAICVYFINWAINIDILRKISNDFK